jgi:HSP20 family protein
MFTDLLGTDRLLTNDLLLEDKWIPAMNIKEKKQNFEIDVAAPGFDKKDFEVTIENGVLCISAEKKEEKEVKEDEFTRKEFNYNSFSRRFTLPENVNEDEKIDAVYKDGILKLVLGKMDIKEIAKKRVIKIS